MTQPAVTEENNVRKQEASSDDPVQSSELTSSRQTSRLAVTCQQCAASAPAPVYVSRPHTDTVDRRTQRQAHS